MGSNDTKTIKDMNTQEFEQAKREFIRNWRGDLFYTEQDGCMLSDLTALLEQHKEVMLEPMRKKLLSMRASKEVMDRLDAEDKLMQYGYHDCINEMLMWLKNVKK